VEVSRVKQTLADLERLAPEDAQPEDFVDLGEHAEFRPEVMEGECSASDGSLGPRASGSLPASGLAHRALTPFGWSGAPRVPVGAR
jgi:hypothetical protein